MREIISIQIGQCGNQVATKYWEFISEEHGINPNGAYHGDSDIQLRGINIHYDEGAKGKYIPRNILIDLDPATEDSIRGGVYGNLFRPDSYISGHNGTGNNWAKGHYTEGAELVDRFMDLVRKEAEMCDQLHGFLFTHSIGGGTGSGLGSCLMGRVREEYPDRMSVTNSVFPSKKISDIVVEPYNAVLTMQHLVECIDCTNVFDNESLFDICSKTYLARTPTYNDLNHLVAGALSGVTCSLRFPGQLNNNLRKMCTNLVPYPRIHFLMVAYAPLALRGLKPYTPVTVPELMNQLFNQDNMMCSVGFREGKCLTAAMMFRGAVSGKEVADELNDLRNKESRYFANWIPDNIKSSFCSIPPKDARIAASLLVNSSAIEGMYRKLVDAFTPLFKRKAYLHWYTSEGMDEMEFVEAESDLHGIISEFQGNRLVDDYDYFDYDEEEYIAEEQVIE